ncbi:hypothetical protein IGI96_002984 [Enterococcus sp. DIV0421]|uniref:hypothetical protein n=1 Tax=Enterococcus sp. DIV0421 TaxID=2774688 RepID=UPI003F1F4035
MNNTLVLVAFFLGIGMGAYIHAVVMPLLLKDERFVEKQRDQAIEKKYGCKRNEFTYFFEGKDDFYILTLGNQEKRIKFSKNRPFQIIYDEAVTFD